MLYSYPFIPCQLDGLVICDVAPGNVVQGFWNITILMLSGYMVYGTALVVIVVCCYYGLRIQDARLVPVIWF